MAAGPGRIGGDVRLIAAALAAGRTRWLTELSGPVADAYPAAVAQLVPVLERSLGSGVVANRVVGRRLEPVGPARRRYLRLVRTGLAPGSVAIVADVRHCYRCIGPLPVAHALASVGGGAAPIERVLDVLGEVRGAGVEGLPIGPAASAVVANAVLRPADLAVAATGARLIRWVDDVVIVGATGRQAWRALDAWTAALGVVGLTMHEGKLRVFTDHQHALAALTGSATQASCSGRATGRGMLRPP